MSSPQRSVVLFFLGLSLVSAGAQTVNSLASSSTPAYQTAVKLMRGVNFGNYLEYRAGDPAANATYTAADFQLARSEGFDHIRLPVAWWIYCGVAPDYTISSTIFTKVDLMVTNALKQGLAIVVDCHHFYDFYANVTGFSDEFYAIWRQVAAHYKDAPSTVVFELLNEPFNVATTTAMNGVYAETIRQIRLTNPNRTILVGAGNYDSLKLDELNQFVLPASDNNLMVVGHCYEPYYFTHQGAEWAYPDTKTTGVLFPGPPPAPLQPDSAVPTADFWVYDWFRQYNTYPTSSNPSSTAAFKTLIKQAKAWCDTRHRPLIINEFGCYYKADAQSRVNFYRSIRETMDAMGIGWTMWDWKSGFHYVANGVPEPIGMREAMFPRPNLVTSGTGSITFSSSIGKTYVVEKTFSLVPPINWQSISTQTLQIPQFTFTDPNAVGAGGYYRVRWVK